MVHSKHYFELFGLPVSYDVDLVLLSERYLTLQQQFHPDKHAHESKRDQTLVQQYATYINDAYESLKSPVDRAQHLLSLSDGGSCLDDHRSLKDPIFLMEQMQLREQLEDLTHASDPEDDIEALFSEARKGFKQVDSMMKELFSQAYPDGNIRPLTSELEEELYTHVQKMQFFIKLIREIEEVEDKLLE